MIYEVPTLGSGMHRRPCCHSSACLMAAGATIAGASTADTILNPQGYAIGPGPNRRLTVTALSKSQHPLLAPFWISV